MPCLQCAFVRPMLSIVLVRSVAAVGTGGRLQITPDTHSIPAAPCALFSACLRQNRHGLVSQVTHARRQSTLFSRCLVSFGFLIEVFTPVHSKPSPSFYQYLIVRVCPRIILAPSNPGLHPAVCSCRWFHGVPDLQCVPTK